MREDFHEAQGSALEELISREAIQERVAQLGEQIGCDYAGESLVLLCVLKGAAIFLSDLARAIPLACRFDFLAAASYGESVRGSGRVHLTKDIDEDLEGQHVLLVEDILDTGHTLSFVMQHLRLRKPKSLRIVALLDKPARRQRPVQADYVGFTIPDRFVVGYGMDHAGKFRNLPNICAYAGEPPE